MSVETINNTRGGIVMLILAQVQGAGGLIQKPLTETRTEGGRPVQFSIFIACFFFIFLKINKCV